jgi:hypothetical protein
MLLGVIKRKNPVLITAGLMKSLTRRQGRRIAQMLKKVKSGKVTWLRWRGIPGRYPKKLSGYDPSGSNVYFISDGELVKIGTASNIPNRMDSLQTGNPKRLKLLAHTTGGHKTEAKYHVMFADCRISGEWFKMSKMIEAEVNRLNQRL